MTMPQANTTELTDLLDALCEGTLTRDGASRLEELVRGNPERQLQYLSYMYLDASLRWVRPGHIPPPTASPEPRGNAGIVQPALPIVIDTSSAMPSGSSSAVQGIVGYFSSGWPMAYLASTVICAIGILILALIPVQHYQQFARQTDSGSSSTTSLPSSLSPLPSSSPRIGRITGMVNCRWKKGAGHAPSQARVSLGDRYVLASGLLEITYDTGAKVILQGPCTYEVESKTGGYLSLGKLTARVEKSEVRGQRSEAIANSPRPSDGGHHEVVEAGGEGDSSPLSTLHSPLFAVRTPTAIVTDLGTEFGVEVDNESHTTSHVFDGRVEVRLRVPGGKKTEPILLAAGEGVCVRPGFSAPRRVSVDPAQFVTVMPRQNMRLNLVASYQFDELVDGFELQTRDNSRNNWLATLLRMSPNDLVPGKNGKALQFNVTDGGHKQCMMVPWSPVFDLVGKSFTLTLWLNRRAAGLEIHEAILHKESPTGGYVVMRLRDSGKLAFRMRTVNAHATIETNTPPGIDDAPEGVWVHFAVVGRFDSATGRYDVELFRNGVRVGGEQNMELGETETPLTLGSVDIASGYAFRGLLDDVRVYDTAITAAQVEFLFENPGGKFDGGAEEGAASRHTEKQGPKNTDNFVPNVTEQPNHH